MPPERRSAAGKLRFHVWGPYEFKATFLGLASHEFRWRGYRFTRLLTSSACIIGAEFNL